MSQIRKARAQTQGPRRLEATLEKWHIITVCLTEEGEKHWVVVRHDEQVDTGKSGAGFKVTKRLPQVILFGTAANKHLKTRRKCMKQIFKQLSLKINF